MTTDGATYRHPACDVGGLSNYRQKMGEPPVWSCEHPVGYLTEKADLGTLTNVLYAEWGALTQKSLPESLKSDLKAWLVSLAGTMKTATLRFHPVEPEHRVMVTAADVCTRMGR